MLSINLDDCASVKQMLEVWLQDDATLSRMRPYVRAALDALISEIADKRRAVLLATGALREANDLIQMLREQAVKPRRRRRVGKKR